MVNAYIGFIVFGERLLRCVSLYSYQFVSVGCLRVQLILKRSMSFGADVRVKSVETKNLKLGEALGSIALYWLGLFGRLSFSDFSGLPRR